MKWSVAKARERFSELLRRAEAEPQEIYNRDRLVAAVLGPESFREVSERMESSARKTLKESFDDMRKLMKDEGYKLEVSPRQNRKSGFPKVLDELPR